MGLLKYKMLKTFQHCVGRQNIDRGKAIDYEKMSLCSILLPQLAYKAKTEKSHDDSPCDINHRELARPLHN